MGENERSGGRGERGENSCRKNKLIGRGGEKENNGVGCGRRG